jgi:hypothetical protein
MQRDRLLPNSAEHILRTSELEYNTLQYTPFFWDEIHSPGVSSHRV